MTKSEELLSYAERKGYRTVCTELPETKSLSLEDGSCYYIGLDTKLTSAEKTVCLAHELGHCDYDGFYHSNSPCETMERMERRARKHSYLMLVPVDEIQSAISNGVVEVWDLAEHFGVTYEFMQSAIEYYRNALGVEFM
ncbi:MAG: ImmA/IrrE family metallo-endopeptidase [Oscillospiraceae bacterium]